ncbi:amidase [Altererythrobacter soli]|uniref:Amidase n=1 Tax=Croceibacterium soli TaxID=1739690 RepID=A0A6I4UVU1_9SPHN|nr:amidase [Croceibacterium soli]MXP41145.1 amidase [Croceibacterium soli]
MPDDQLAFATATEQLRMLDRREVSASELLELYLDRIERLDGNYNLVVAFDRERARATAADIDLRRERGDALGPLAGLPITVKDSFEVVGMPATCGLEHLRDHRPDQDADAVARLRGAGVNVFGKTNLPAGASDWQSFNPIYGISRNPWNPDRTVGGSSGGAAGAVAAGFTSFELGSDIGGSIRIPSHFCGVFGHKPTYGLVSTRGQIPPPPGALSQPELGVAGPIARSADDLALVLSVLAGKTLAPARHEQLGDFRVGVWMGDGAYRVDGAYRGALEAYIADLRRAGASIEEVGLPVDPQESYETYLQVLFALVGAPAPQEADAFERLADQDETGMAAKLARYMRTSLGEWFELAEKREHLFRAWARFFGQYDLLVCPAVPVVAFPHMAEGSGVHSDQLFRRVTIDGEPAPYLDFTWQGLALVANLPATVMPTGHLVDGLPTGLQIIGPHSEDLTAIRFAALAAQAAGAYLPPPALS